MKRAKLDPVEEDAEYSSALALASLASFKASSADEMTATTTTGMETGPVPVSPESRLPPETRRVTFDPTTKEVERTQPRRVSYPPRVRGSRLPPGFGRGQQYSAQPLHYHRHQMGVPSPWFTPHRMMTSQRFMPPPQQQHSNRWICDYCNVVSFPTYEEACLHEQNCRLQYGSICHPQYSYWMQSSTAEYQGTRDAAPLPSAKEGQWCEGTTPLAVPHSDADWLSELNCYIRSVCVEVFTQGGEATTGRMDPKKVGVRCTFCKERTDNEKDIAAVSYPTSTDGIYESVRRWHRVHCMVCPDITQDVKTKLAQLSTASAWIANSRQYWVDSAKALGMVDTDDGIRFERNPEQSLSQAKEKSLEKEVSDVNQTKGEPLVTTADISIIPPYVYFLMRQVETCKFTEADRFIARSKGQLGFAGFQCRHCNGHAGLGKYFPLTCKSLATNSTSQNVHAHLLKCRKCPQHVKDQLVVLKDEKGRAPRLEPGWRKIFFDKIWVRLHGEKPKIEPVESSSEETQA